MSEPKEQATLGMLIEEIKYENFVVEATRVGGQVQHACALASGLANPTEAFDLIHSLLNACIDEIGRYEQRIRDSHTLPLESKNDGN